MTARRTLMTDWLQVTDAHLTDDSFNRVSGRSDATKSRSAATIWSDVLMYFLVGANIS